MPDRDYIEIRGARENNLKNVDLKIPKRKITIFTGVSGSGKSSLVFDTIAAEARRQLNDTFSTFVRNFLPRYSQPEADAIDNLSMAIIVDQKHLGGGSHSTVGTITDIYSFMRLLFSRAGSPKVAFPTAFSFNEPQGWCPECNGLGRKLGVDMDRFLDPRRSLNQGAILFPEYAVDSWGWNVLQQSGLFDMDKPVDQYTAEELQTLLYAEPYKVKINMGGKSMNLSMEGIIDRFRSKYINRDLNTMSERTQKSVEPFMTMGPCTTCNGARLNRSALACKINGLNIAEMANMEVDDLIGVISAIQDPLTAPIVAAIVDRLQHMIDIGLEYLSLDRATDTLSGGESQRIKMVKHLGSSLVDVMYVFDEPSIGMHPRDVHRLNELLQKLRDKGNTVLVVEHDPDVIRFADHIVDVGPRAGKAGGNIVFQGNYLGLLQSGTLTGKFLATHQPVKTNCRIPQGHLAICDAKTNNLKNLNVDIPAGILTVVTGVAGSGKSTLINQVFLSQHPGAIVIDQSPIGVSSRSNPATYTGILNEVRKAFASANKVNASLFSFNSKGACETCQGLGVVYTDLAYMDEVKSPCETCGGKRFKDEVLSYKLNGLSIADVLALSVEDAMALLEIKEIHKKLASLVDVGLHYLNTGATAQYPIRW